MRLDFTFIKSIFVLVLTLSLAQVMNAQELINVSVTSNVFSPANLTINVGDTVLWTNMEGTHNVNGTTNTYPDNPESFGNMVGSDWTFMHVFTVAGNYDYQCDPHVDFGMTGTITVETSVGIEDLTDAGIKLVRTVYPTPASDQVVVELMPEVMQYSDGLSLIVLDVAGRKVVSLKQITGHKINMDTRNWSQGTYVFQLMSQNKVVASGSILIQK